MTTQHILLQNAHSKLEVSLIGAQVLNFEILDNQSNWESAFYTGTTAKRTGIPLLFPFADPLDNNIFEVSGLEIPQHGFGRVSQWTLFEQTSNNIVLSLSYQDLDEQWRLAYPFQFEVRVYLDLSIPKQLGYKLEVINLEEEKNLPIAPGLHPYFPCPIEDKPNLEIFINNKKAMVDLNATGAGDYHGWKNAKFKMEREKLDDQLDTSLLLHSDTISSGKKHKQILPLPGLEEDSFSSQTSLNLKTARVKVANRYEVEILDLGGKAENLVFWTQNDSALDHDFICLEPFTKKTNSINIDPILLKPGEYWDWKLLFRVKWPSQMVNKI